MKEIFNEYSIIEDMNVVSTAITQFISSINQTQIITEPQVLLQILPVYMIDNNRDQLFSGVTLLDEFFKKIDERKDKQIPLDKIVEKFSKIDNSSESQNTIIGRVYSKYITKFNTDLVTDLKAFSDVKNYFKIETYVTLLNLLQLIYEESEDHTDTEEMHVFNVNTFIDAIHILKTATVAVLKDTSNYTIEDFASECTESLQTLINEIAYNLDVVVSFSEADYKSYAEAITILHMFYGDSTKGTKNLKALAQFYQIIDKNTVLMCNREPKRIFNLIDLLATSIGGFILKYDLANNFMAYINKEYTVVDGKPSSDWYEMGKQLGNIAIGANTKKHQLEKQLGELSDSDEELYQSAPIPDIMKLISGMSVNLQFIPDDMMNSNTVPQGVQGISYKNKKLVTLISNIANNTDIDVNDDIRTKCKDLSEVFKNGIEDEFKTKHAVKPYITLAFLSIFDGGPKLSNKYSKQKVMTDVSKSLRTYYTKKEIEFTKIPSLYGRSAPFRNAIKIFKTKVNALPDIGENIKKMIILTYIRADAGENKGDISFNKWFMARLNDKPVETPEHTKENSINALNLFLEEYMKVFGEIYKEIKSNPHAKEYNYKFDALTLDSNTNKGHKQQGIEEYYDANHPAPPVAGFTAYDIALITGGKDLSQLDSRLNILLKNYITRNGGTGRNLDSLFPNMSGGGTGTNLKRLAVYSILLFNLRKHIPNINNIEVYHLDTNPIVNNTYFKYNIKPQKEEVKLAIKLFEPLLNTSRINQLNNVRTIIHEDSLAKKTPVDNITYYVGSGYKSLIKSGGVTPDITYDILDPTYKVLGDFSEQRIKEDIIRILES